MSNRFTKASLLTGTFMAGAMMVSPAYAQSTDPDDATDQDNPIQASPSQSDETSSAPGEEGLIVVTGSRIARRNVETAAPIAVVQDEEFKLSGTVNVENVINTLPQVLPGLTSASNNPGNGTSSLNLRGLGETRTLVLVNGRRWMFYDSGQIVDLNTIPSFLIDSVDVVTGGASAVYGSDALSGVVNFRLRGVEGAEVGGQYALTERGDGASYQVHGALGASFDDGRGNATVFAEYFNRSPLFQGQREFSNFALGGESFDEPLQQFGSSTLPSGVIRYFGNGNRAGTDFAANRAVVFDVPREFRTRTGDTYNYAPANYLQLPQERYLVGGFADYEIADGHEFYTEVTFVNNRVAQELAPTPVTGTFNVNLATIRPFLNPGDFAQLQQLDATETGTGASAPNNGQLRLFLQRRVTETGSRNSLDERNAFRVLGGVRGELTDWLNYDAYYMYARTRNANIQAGNISRSAFQAGLDGTAAPINIFGPNTLTPAMVDAISIQAQNGDVSTLEVANAALSGTFGNLGMGADDIGFAVGAEYRRVASQFLPDTALSSGDVIGFNAGDSTEGDYNVREVFAELNVPIIQDSFIHRLEVTGAARYSDYSLDAVGGVYTYAGGVQFAPIRDVLFRGQYQRAIRAPNVGELFTGQSIGFPGATDPCASANFIAANPGARALCIATGVPAGNVGGGTAVQINAQIPALFGGNPDLEEETSDSYTFGVVLQPRFVPGLTITADYFNIKIEDAIALAGGGLQGSFNLCFGTDGVQDLNNPICAPFLNVRNSAGQIDVSNPPLISVANIAEVSTSGVDLEVSYGTSLPFSFWTDTGEQRIQFSFLGTWLDSFKFVPVAGLADFVECAGEFGGRCGEPRPDFRWTSRVSLIDGPVTASVRWRHLDSVRDNDDDVAFEDFNGVETIESYDVFDLSFAFDVTERFSISMGVNNILDKLPGTPEFDGIIVSNRPNRLLLGDNQEQANTYPSTYDTLGRRYFVSALFKF